MIPGDPNRYHVGRLPSAEPGAPHQVVTAVQAYDGTRGAAAICTDLLRSFPDVQLIIFTGIAAGVPRDADHPVALGDIVVGRGLVDYGHVRLEKGHERLRRAVDGLSPVMLRADLELEVKERSGQLPWRQAMTSPGLPDAYARPREHGAEEGLARWPRVHRGPIGSADRLLNDTAARDAIGREHWLLALEMEGAGAAVAAHLHGRHRFVVRGVSDLGDEDKNDHWRGYAAMAAAAYTRALLAECRPFTHGPTARSARGGNEGLSAIVAVLLDIPAMRDDYQRRAIIAALPSRIRTTIPDNVIARLHVLSIVETCGRFPDGREALCAALQLALGDDTPDVRHAEEILERFWPTI